MRGQPRRFTHSAVMAWAALDRAVHGVEDHGLDGPVERWRAVRAEIRADVLANGYDSSRGTFVQYYGGSTTDAALLQIVQVGFLDPQDERFLGTLAAIRADLEVAEGLVHRYLTEQTDDGLLAEEYDVEGGRMAGNFPQALCHLAPPGTGAGRAQPRPRGPTPWYRAVTWRSTAQGRSNRLAPGLVSGTAQPPASRLPGVWPLSLVGRSPGFLASPGVSVAGVVSCPAPSAAWMTAVSSASVLVSASSMVR